MRVGTKSLLFGVHQFIWHPLFVLAGWVWLFGRPSLGELLAIVIHDWGYWGKPNMDGKEGNTHPEWAGLFFERWGRKDLADMCRAHSRFWAKKKGLPLGKLTYADKIGSAIMPIWLWVAAARATGEFWDYVNAPKHEVNRNSMGTINTTAWFREYRYLVCKIIGEDLGAFKRSA